jgi:hypothetical protein
MGFGQKLPNTVNPALRRRLNASQKKKRMNARQGIYALIVIISLFMDKKELNDFIIEIKNEFRKLDSKINTIPISEIERFMGLNFKWYDLIKS